MFPRERGVALVITLIMISVITFMAVTFLAISRREKGQVATTTEQFTARIAADAGHERAIAEMLTAIFTTTNAQNFGLLVSTNFSNPAGFQSGVNHPTNVNFDAASALNLTEQQRNLANLLYNARAPIFITNKFLGSNEFRFYVDLNRDRVHTPNGWLGVTNELGEPVLTSTNTILTNYFVGDPEFIGILRRAEFPHSANNEFLSRYAFIVIPAGKTLDVNYIHNYAKLLNLQLRDNVGDGFRRNQGVSAGENNLASLLVDLNTNAWPFQAGTTLGSPYQYLPNDIGPNRGAAFDDALSLLRYRYATNYKYLGPGPAWREGIDVYCRSPLMSNVFGLTLDRDPEINTSTPNWHGSENPNHIFRGQDFFDLGKMPPSFVNRLKAVTTSTQSPGKPPSSYNTYTYYRMLSQLGTDAAPEPPGKMNLNWDNLVYRDPFTGAASVTNFQLWGATAFFTNAADRLVRRYSEDWRDLNFRTHGNNYTYTNTYGTDQIFGASRIPVFVNGKFVFSPSLHRQLQLAANMWDSLHGTRSNVCGTLPTVFRPIFANENGSIYINDFREVANYSELRGRPMRDLSDTNIVNSVQPDDLIFGVPLIIGARKGLPNFNEFAAETVIQFTRKLELVKSAPGGGNTIFQTNQMFVIGISNVFGAEFWNSYTRNYTCPVEVLVTNLCTVSLTNDYNFRHPTNLIAAGAVNLATWAAWKPKVHDPPATGPWSFVVPLRTNHVIIPDSAYRLSGNRFDQLTTTFERPSGFAFPRWGLAITNRVVGIIKEPGPNGRILDYVQLNGMTTYRDLSLDIAQASTARGVAGVWGTNAPAGGSFLSGEPGIVQQIQISKGEVNVGEDWQNHGVNQAAGETKFQAIANFLAFFEPSHTYTYQPGDGSTFYGTNYGTVANAPFTPTSKRSIPIIWQANDPLVHYTSGDMEYVERSGVPISWTPPVSNTNTIENLGKLNARYRPWGNGANSAEDDNLAFHTVVKDPGVTRSDDWQFPTNMLPNIGWMGRIHRGTPWQTVYLKSSRVVDAVKGRSMKADDWKKWTGNKNVWTDSAGKNPLADLEMTQPEHDRSFLELFTTALNENAGRGQLPINQSGLAAWSAVFGGMVALTNTVADDELTPSATLTGYGPQIIEPAGNYDPENTNTWGAVMKIVDGINRTRTNTALFPSQTFKRLGDLLATPALTEASPFLNQSQTQKEQGLSDMAYEWLPQQMLSLVRLDEPRFVIYSYGQALKPANRAIQVSGPFAGMATNYQIMAEVVTRAVVRVEGSPDPRNTSTNLPPAERYPPHIIVENFNVLPPD